MPNSIPNDIYQYSLLSAYKSGLDSGGPLVAFLTNHGTHGIGVFEDGDSMIQIDSKAYALDRDGHATKAGQDRQQPFVMVNVFQPTHRRVLPKGATVENVQQVLNSSKNTPMPFSVAGSFRNIQLEGTAVKHVTGTVFGYAIPSWQKDFSGEGLQCCFLSENRTEGGKVVSFEAAEEVHVQWAKCGRFHLGFPQDDAYENLDL